MQQALGHIPEVAKTETEVLAFALPRTAVAAAYRLNLTLACHQHDLRVGRGCFHLFRLSLPLEERMAQLPIQTPVDPTHLVNQVQYLTELSEGIAIDCQAGPVRVGTFHDFVQENPESLACLAKHYLTAYQGQYQTFPYFS